jgi:sulfite reductase alpha subunit-like flavoprotein
MMAFFFGCRKREHDYHYGEEFEARKEEGTLSLFEVAFSRDQAQKVYVQHKIKERGREIWEMIQLGGYFFISGSASQMPTDVRKTVLEILQTEGGLTSSEEAENLLKKLELTGRFATETWQ